MNIIIKGTNIEITDKLRQLINEKIGSLYRFLQNMDEGAIEARVEVGKPSLHHKTGFVYYAEANFKIPGTLLRAEAEHVELEFAINEVKNELEKQIKTYKGKLSEI